MHIIANMKSSIKIIVFTMSFYCNGSEFPFPPPPYSLSNDSVNPPLKDPRPFVGKDLLRSKDPLFPPPPYSLSNDMKHSKLDEFFNKYDISPYIRSDIASIPLDKDQHYKIILVCDDSTSMINHSSFFCFKRNQMVQGTRWDELRQMAEIIMELVIAMNDGVDKNKNQNQGIDFWFLNSPLPHKNVKSLDRVAELFTTRYPYGSTPLIHTMKKIIKKPLDVDIPKLILIITDGKSIDSMDRSNYVNFTQLLKHQRKPNTNRISIACISSKQQMRWMDQIDKNTKYVHVTSNYLMERKQILKIQGHNLRPGDHILKTMLGPILPKYQQPYQSHLSPQLPCIQPNVHSPIICEQASNDSCKKKKKKRKKSMILVQFFKNIFRFNHQGIISTLSNQ